MEYYVAVSSRDGIMVHQHFGHTEAFLILRVTDNKSYEAVERREVKAVCRMHEHDEGEMEKTAELLSDCKYVLSSQIGQGAQQVLRSNGIIPLEITHYIDYAMKKVMLYDDRKKFVRSHMNTSEKEENVN